MTHDILISYGEREESALVAMVCVILMVYFLYASSRAKHNQSSSTKIWASALAATLGIGTMLSGAVAIIFRAVHTARESGDYAAVPPSYTPLLAGATVALVAVCAIYPWFGRDHVTRRVRWTMGTLTASLLIATISVFSAVMGADVYWGPWIDFFYGARDVSAVVAVLIVPAAVVDGVRYGRTLRRAHS